MYLLQRATALVMAPLVLIHIGVMIYAVRGGLSAGEILDRTSGSVGWALFYGLFVVAASVHGTIGLRFVLTEWTPWRGRSVDMVLGVFLLVLLVLGFRAVVAVTS